jgi:hypothetical protein
VNQPKPRTGTYFGMPIVNQHFPDGTWLEGEEFCYPGGGMGRRAYVVFPDGVYRVVRCGIPDTFFSIPAAARLRMVVRGFVSRDGEGLAFTQTDPSKAE